MEQDREIIDPLMLRWLAGEAIDPAEASRINDWLVNSPGSLETFKRLSDQVWLAEALKDFKNPSIKAENLQMLQQRLQQLNKPVRRIAILFYIAAASVILCLAFALISRYITTKSTGAAPQTGTFATLIHPGSSKATLTLSTGQQILLDSGSTGTVNIQHGLTAKTERGQISYNAAIGHNEVATMNTVTTPKAGMFSIILPDLTKVWLNNASSLQYPTLFDKSTREVTLTGEAYFEVSKNRSKPFIVHCGNSSVEVLGTHFNISSYADEELQKVTLLEGSVRVSVSGSSIERTIRPGDQAQLATSQTDKIEVLHNIDTDEVIAWKNGYFHFSHTDLPAALRQIARWYDVDVQYKGNVGTEPISGKIGRNLPLSDILSGLETNNIHFEIQDRKIIVRP